MGKRGRSGKPRNSLIGSNGNDAITLREEKTGTKSQSSNQKFNNKSNGKGVAIKFNDRLKIEHLERLSSWAAGEAKIPSLAAFYGQRLAAVRESLGMPPNRSLLQCERCETVLKPDTNCNITARKNKFKAQKMANEKSCAPAQNYLVYSCHFCSHRNLKRDTTRQHLKEPCPSKTKADLMVPGNNLNTCHESTSSRIEYVAIELSNIYAPAIPIAATGHVKETYPSTSEAIPNLILAEPKSSVQPNASEKISEGEYHVNLTVGGKDKANAVHESILSDAPATPIAATEHVKEICHSTAKATPYSVVAESNSPMQPNVSDDVSRGKFQDNTMDESVEPPTPTASSEICITNDPASPAVRSGLTLLDANKRKRKKSTSKKTIGTENRSAPADAEATDGKSSKRKRKSWTSLKEIADSNEQAKKKNIYSLPIPFSLESAPRPGV